MTLMKALRKLSVVCVMGAGVAWMMVYLQGGCHRKVGSAGGAPAPRRVAQATEGGRARLAPVRRVTTMATESAVGTVRPIHEAAVASKIFERVVEVNVLAGQQVKKDQVLVRLDDSLSRARLDQAQAAMEAAQASLDQAQIDLDAVTQAFKIKAATQSELDRAANTLKSRQAEQLRAASVRREAQIGLDLTVVLSPMDGIVIDKKVSVGDTVAQGQVLLTLYDPTRMQLEASVRESLAQQLKVGQPIRVRIQAMGGDCQGHVSEIVPEAQSATRTFLVKVAGACGQGVYAGMYGRMIIPVGDETMLVIPRQAVRKIGQLDVVDVAPANEPSAALERRSVQLGRETELPSEPRASAPAEPEQAYQVLSGLREGEWVLLPAGGAKAGEP